MLGSPIRRSLLLGLTSLFAAMVTLAWPLSAAQAHAAYLSSTPAANQVLIAAPTNVTITFAQNLDPHGLSITVYDSKAKVVSTGTAQISATDPKTATVTMKGDDSDIYRVDWTTVSAEDGDATLGAFVFGVDPSGKTDKVPPTASTATDTGTPGWVAIVTGIAGLAVGFLGATLLRGQQQPTTA